MSFLRSKSFYYKKTGLRHKALIIAEGFQFQKDNNDTEVSYITRSLISEGQVRYLVTVKDKNDNWTPEEIVLEGPTSFITTTIKEELEEQLEDRLFTVHSNQTKDQTKRIIMTQAILDAGIIKEIDEKTIRAYQEFQKNLSPCKVKIPFMPQVAEDFIKYNLPISTRRAFGKVRKFVKAIACSYQHQRKRDAEEYIIAEMQDYYMAYQICLKSFRENMGEMSKLTKDRLTLIKDEGPISLKDLAIKAGVERPTISKWLKNPDVREAVLWCKKNGDEFADEEEMRKAKRSGDAYLKIRDDFTPTVTATLPTPYELTNDPVWQKGGELYDKYNLELDKEDIEPDLPKDEEVDPLPEIIDDLTVDSIENSMDDCMLDPDNILNDEDLDAF